MVSVAKPWLICGYLGLNSNHVFLLLQQLSIRAGYIGPGR